MLLVIEQFHSLENCHRVAQQEPRTIMEELLLQTPHQSNQRIVSELPRVSNKISWVVLGLTALALKYEQL